MPKQKPSPLTFAPTERVGLFIDGAELHATAKALGFDIDFKRLLALFRRSARLIRAHYYTLLPDGDTRDQVHQLVDWLEYNGFTTVTKRVRDNRSSDRQTTSSRMHIELAVDAMQLADGLDHMVIMSGHGDFRSLVAMLQGQGKRVSVLSTLSTRPAMIADELRRQADHFIDLADLEDEIRR
jgi:uncharacterized LabA/DUF88 family protein